MVPAARRLLARLQARRLPVRLRSGAAAVLEVRPLREVLPLRRGLQAAAAWPAATPAGRPHGNRFRLSTEHQLNLPVGIELDDVRGSLIDDPDVVLWIDVHGLREVEAVHPDADLLDELAGLIELEQPRAGL